MGRHQRAETAGLLSCVLCGVLAWSLLTMYVQGAPAIGLVSGRLYLMSCAVVALCTALSFIVGYARRSGSWTLAHGWWMPLRRVVEIAALTTVYASTVYLCVFALLGVIDSIVGIAVVKQYIAVLTAGFAAVSGYMGYVQADNLSAKTIASLLPVFIIAGVSTAGLSSDDPNWWKNNFSQLGDRTTFAATMFNVTIILAGICIIIVSYFAISELVTTHRMWELWRATNIQESEQIAQINEQEHAVRTTTRLSDEVAYALTTKHHLLDRMLAIQHFKARIIVLAALLVAAGLCFAGVGIFRYSPHPIMHNVCARGLTIPMSLLMILLPWLVPQFSRSIYVVSDCIIVIIAVAGVRWLMHADTLTNVEALACLLFLGWFVVFSRQIAAMEADRVQIQLTAMHPILNKADSRLSPER